MVWFQSPRGKYIAVGACSAVLGFLAAWPLFAAGQDKKDAPADPAAKQAPAADKAADPKADLADQIRQLNAKVARLEAAVAKAAPAAAGMNMAPAAKPGMGMMDMMGGMAGGKKPAMGGMAGMEDMDTDEMKGMGAMGGGKAGMGGMMDMDMMEMMGMMGMAPKSAGGMAGMKSMGKMQMKAALPSFPGASHIYHVGATDFFLNHPEHITLTPKQTGDLGRVKEKAVLAKTSAQRKIDEAEQELWTLTSADEPDAAKIEAKIQEIEKSRGAQRMALIRAVGDAAKLLTDEQRQALLGTGPAKAGKADPHAGHTP